MADDELTQQSRGEQRDHQIPRDAASLVIVDHDATGAPRVLMGRRHPDSAFLPNKYVFPGGRFDPQDATVAPARPLSQRNIQNLSLSPTQQTDTIDPTNLALTALRETFEETGIVVGTRRSQHQRDQHPDIWQPFFATGHSPDPSQLTFFARAITPPGRPRRFDTRFFCVLAKTISTQQMPADNELSDVGWIGLEQAANMDIANITRFILADVKRLKSGTKGIIEPAEIPFYSYETTGFERVLLSHQGGIA